jgi:hypothetical protein
VGGGIEKENANKKSKKVGTFSIFPFDAQNRGARGPPRGVEKRFERGFNFNLSNLLEMIFSFVRRAFFWTESENFNMRGSIPPTGGCRRRYGAENLASLLAEIFRPRRSRNAVTIFFSSKRDCFCFRSETSGRFEVPERRGASQGRDFSTDNILKAFFCSSVLTLLMIFREENVILKVQQFGLCWGSLGPMLQTFLRT